MIAVRLKNVSRHGKQRSIIECNVENGPVEIVVEGHSGAGVRNNDVVCAAVSALTQTAILAIQQVARIKQDVDQKTGYLYSAIDINRAGPDQLAALQVIISTMLLGLEKIVDEHPERMTLHFE